MHTTARILIALLLSGSIMLANESRITQHTFSHIPSSDILPQSGWWVSEGFKSTSSGCPGILKTMIKQFENSAPEKQNLTFTKPFHPKQIFQDDGGAIAWKKVGPNKYKGTIKEPQATIVYYIGVASKDKMKVGMHMQMNMPAEMMKMLGTKSASCTQTSTGFYRLDK